MWLAFPASNYYGGSATTNGHLRTAHFAIPLVASRMIVSALKQDDLGAGYSQPFQLAAGSRSWWQGSSGNPPHRALTESMSQHDRSARHAARTPRSTPRIAQTQARVGKLLRGVGLLSHRLKSGSFRSPYRLSAKPLRLGRLPRASQGLSGPAISPWSASTSATAQRLVAS